MTMYKETVLFADEDETFCEGLLKYLKSQRSFEIGDVARDGVEVLSKLEKLPTDIVIMSIRIMHSDWTQTSRMIRQKFPSTTIIVLSESNQNAREAIKAGVNVFMSKELPFADILRTIGSVNEKSSLVFPHDFAGAETDRGVAEPKASLVTKREKEVLVLLAKGLQNKEIAYSLSINVSTVNNHLAHIFRKLGCSNRTEAVFSAVKKGVIEREK
jgi:DNA-binding NarL/FixJ family response regulator